MTMSARAADLVKQLDACKQNIFDRYDVNQSGTLNEEERTQLTTNLCMKLHIPVTVDSIEQLCAETPIDDLVGWELETFVDWFTQSFILGIEYDEESAIDRHVLSSQAGLREDLPLCPTGSLYHHALDSDGDYCWIMMFPQEDHERFKKLPWSLTFTDEFKQECREKRDEIITSLLRAGLALKFHVTTAGDEYVVHIGGPPDLLQYVATQIQLPVKCARVTQHGTILGYQPFDLTRVGQYMSAHAEEELQPINNTEFRFRTKAKLQLIKHIIQVPWNPASNQFGAGIDVSAHMAKGAISCGVISQFFPLHDQDLHEFDTTWCSWKLAFDHKIGIWKIPHNEIRDYFGERIAVYFAFLAAYTRGLVTPAVSGLFSALCIWLFRDTEYEKLAQWIVVLFCALIVTWSTLFLENWKRAQSMWAHDWGMNGLGTKEQPMPGFDGKWDPVLEVMVYDVENTGDRSKRLYCSALVTFLCIGFTAGIMLFFVALNWILTVQIGAPGGMMVGIVNSMSIVGLNSVFKELAASFTTWENHRTETEFQDALIIKCVIFQFVASFFSMYIVGFLKPWSVVGHPAGTNPFSPAIESNQIYQYFGACSCREYIPADCYNSTVCTDAFCTNLPVLQCACTKHACQDDVGSLLATLFISQLLIGNVMEIVVPKIVFYFKEKLKMRDDGTDEFEPPAEREAKMPNYQEFVYAGIFDDYNELALQFGFVTLFASNFPMIGAFAFINNIVEIRSDAYKFCHVYRRPDPKPCETIGTWYSVLELLTFAAVTTNCANVFLVSDFSADMSWPGKVGGLFVAEHVVYLIKVIIGFYIPDIPAEVLQEMEFEEFLKEKAMSAQLLEKCDSIFTEKMKNYRDPEIEPDKGWVFQEYNQDNSKAEISSYPTPGSRE